MEEVDPVYKYIDSSIKELKSELLKTQRFLAELSIRATHNESTSHREAYQKAASQFVSEVTSAFLRVYKSTKPLRIASEFGNKRRDDLQKLGVKLLKIK